MYIDRVNKILTILYKDDPKRVKSEAVPRHFSVVMSTPPCEKE